MAKNRIPYSESNWDEFIKSLEGLSHQEIERLAWIRYRAELKTKGLLDPKWKWFAFKSVLLGIASLAIVYLLRRDPPLWLLATLALSSAIISTQIALLAHAVGHRQIVRARLRLRILSLVYGPGLLAFAHSWWNKKHNQHHATPNQVGRDPDLVLGVAILSEKQGLEGKNKLQRLLIRHEYVLPAFFLLQALNARWSSIMHLVHNKVEDRVIQLAGISMHIAVYFWVLSPLGWKYCAFFVLIHQLGFGFYNSVIFASNHKGMVVTGEDDPQLGPFGEQVLTSRNVKLGKLNFLNNIVYGGLDDQIGHHCAAEAPVENLGKINAITKKYCTLLGMPYVEVNPIQAYWEVLKHLWRTSRWARAQKRLERSQS